MARLRHIDLERTGARVLVALTIYTLLMVSVSALMQVAAQDLFAAVNAARGTGEFTSRTVYGRWLSAQLSADVPADDLDARQVRADELSFHSDRLLELAAVPAVVGLLAALLTDSPRGCSRTSPSTRPRAGARRYPRQRLRTSLA